MIKSWKEFRENYPEFEYSNYSFELQGNLLVISFEYFIKGHKFVHKDVFYVDGDQIAKVKTPEFSNLIFQLGIAEMFSYWKATCSPIIKISAGYLDINQLQWWKELLLNGMGQYFYENEIDFNEKDFVSIKTTKSGFIQPPVGVSGGRILVPVSGGKDSTVTLDILQRNSGVYAGLVVKPTSFAAVEVAKKSGLKNIIQVERIIDPILLDLNSKGFLNGHIPYSNVLFFISLVVSHLYSCKYVAFSNEKSSDESNLRYKGIDINHQYTKSFNFEKKFQQYNKTYLSDIDVFSFLRPLYDIQISRLFSRTSKYFDLVKSCNVGQKEGVWCCKCPKCLSTFILLFPFLGIKKILRIFPRNLFDDGSLKNVLDKLLSKDEVKPFECVGTRGELKVALFLALKIYGKDILPSLLEYARREYIMKGDLNNMSKKILNNWETNNILPEDFAKVLKFSYENA